ncbi:MAG: hypothetical protein K2W95_24505 [Candidatus Obscuribacterales bacterium]|nr:hypothetical protein [Candidatus Obscuribacterales bacterium]
MELRKNDNAGVNVSTSEGKSHPAAMGRQVVGALSILSLVQMAVPWAALSEELHLGSGETAHTVDQNFAGTVNLTVNGETKTVGAGSQLTGAEYATFLNAIGGQAQTLTIGQGGVATGGYVNLTPQLAQTITGLVVPTNVSLLHNVGELQTLNLTGNLTNSGNYFAFSTNNAITNGIINASNLYNNQNALLTSVLPSGGLPGGITGAISNLSLTLNIVNNLFNAGAITSAGNLNINAGAIYNQLPAGVTGASPIMQAVNNLNLNATLGNITNSGAMAAVMGNVNLASVNNMVINNVNGSIQALMGNINVRDAAFDAAKNLDILGGKFVSQQLNLNSGKGDVNVDIIGATGLINVAACNLHINSEDTVNLGTLNLGGDPGIYSTYGDINIGGSIVTNGQPLALVASGSIRTTVAGLTINTENPGGDGGSIFISAGGLVDQTGLDSAVIRDRESFRRLGGNIDFSTFALGSPLSANGGSGRGGDITLITLGGEVYAGTIAVPTAVSSTGTSGMNGGNILILADAQPQNVNNYASLVLGGGVDSSATGGGNGGSITIATAKPALNTAGATDNPVAVIAGDALSPASTITKSTVRNMALEIVGGVTSTGTNGGAVDIQAGTQLTITGPVVASGSGGGTGGNVTLASNSNVAFTTGLPGGQRNGVGGVIVSQGNNGNGGQIAVTNSGTGGIVVTNPGDLNAAAGFAGNGGSISLSAANGDLRFLTGGVLAAFGPNNGGAISLTGARVIGAAGGLVSLSAGGAAGNGGTVSITQTRDGEALTIGTGATHFVAQVNGAVNGGSVTASSAGNLTVDPAGLAINGGANGSNLSFATTGSNPLARLLVTGALSVNGNGNGTGGSIVLQSVSAENFLLGGATVNGTVGTLSANGSGTGGGGAVTVTSARSMTVTSNVTALGGGTSGSGGTISLTASGSGSGAAGLVLASTGVVNVSPTNGNGGTLALTSTAAPLQIVAPGTLNVNAVGTGNGGTVTINAHSLAMTGVALSANAAGTGSGGAVSVTTTSNVSALNVGTGADPIGSITANGVGSPANAGRVSLTSAQDLTVDMAGVTASPGADGNGAIFNFTAGTAASAGGSGNLRVVGALTANAGGVGTGGQVNLTSNSNLPFLFNLGLGGLNGLTGNSVSANGGTTSGAAGSISINNTGNGGITVSPANLNLLVTDGGGGSLSLTAANGALNLGAGLYSVSAVSAGTVSAGGTFTATARDIVSGGLTFIIANGAAAGGAGGSISITETGDTANSPFFVAGGFLFLSAAAGGGAGGAGGSVSVSVPRDLTVDPGVINVSPVVQGAGGRISLTAGTAVRGDLVVTMNSVNVDGVNGAGGTILLSATGNVTVENSLSARGTGTGAGGSITINANGLNPFLVNVNSGSNRVFGTINASSAGGAGGRLSITNPSGITIPNLTSINLAAGNGAGGTLTLSAANGVIAIDSTAQNFIDLNGTAGSGGQFNLTASSFNITGGTVQLRAQGAGGGGGVFNVTSTAANADLSVQAMGQFTILGGGVAIPQQTVQNVLPIPAGTTVLTLPAVTGLAAGQQITVTQGTLTETVSIVSVDTVTNQITVTALTNTFPAMMAQPVVAVVNTSSGTVSLNSGRNLTVVSADVQVAPTGNGPGANYSYNAGTSGAPGDLLVTGTINAAAIGGVLPNQAGGAVTLTSTRNTRIVGDIITTGTGNVGSGSVTLTSNSNSLFTVDPTNPTALNGVAGIINTSSAGNVGGNVTITNNGVGGIDIRNASVDLIMTSGGGSGASFTANAGLGVFSVQQTSTINVNGIGGTLPSGGTVSITAGSIETTGHLSITAQGIGGPGGTVTLNATGASSFIEIHKMNVGAIDINTDATDGNGGTINVTAGTRLLIDPAGLSNKTGDGGTGRNMTFTATGQAGGCCGSILFTAPVNFSGQTTGVVVNVNSVTPFTIGSPGTSGNGIVMDAMTSVAVNMNGTGGGSGGNFSINQTGAGGVVISNGAIITARAGDGNTPFVGGSVSISAGSGGLTLGNGTIDVGVPSTAIPPVVPTIVLGTIVPAINGGTGSPQANGGSITITSNRLTINAGATGAFNLLAQGGVSGQGGSVNVTLTDSNTALNIGSLVGQFNIDARGGAVGGRITLSSGQNLNVTAANAQFGNFGALGNFDGGRVSLTAAGNVFWNGNLSAAGQGVGDGGQVTIRHGGFSPFYINAGNFGSGINGTLSVATGLIAGNGGLIDISTTGFAGILINGGFTFNANALATPGGVGSPQAVGGIAGGDGATSGTMNGGTVNINTNSITLLTAGTTTMTANGDGSGNGGSINFNHRLLGIQVGGVGNNFAFTATGGSTTSSGSTAGNGGSITLTSNSNLNIQTVGGVTFNAGPSGATGNGATYALTSGAFGNVVVNGTLSANGVAASGMFGDGGTIRITQPGSALFGIGAGLVGFGVNGNITADASINGGKGGTINLALTTSTVQLNGGGIVSARGAISTGAVNSDGGTITFNANVVNHSGAGGFLFRANGSTASNGGTINFTSNSSAISAGTVSNTIAFSAGAGGPGFNTNANGGTVNLTASSLNIDPNGISVEPTGNRGNGGTMVLTATNGALVVSGSLNANGGALAGNGGRIDLISNSGAAFQYNNGAAPFNGINGNASAAAGLLQGNGGTILVRNNQPVGITVGAAATFNVLNANLLGQTAGTVTLDAGNGALVINAPTISTTPFIGNGGTINLTGASITGPAGVALVLSSDGGLGGNGGTVAVRTNQGNSNVGNLTIGNLAGNISIRARGGTSPSATNGGTIDINAAGFQLTVDPTAALLGTQALNGDAGTLRLTAAGNAASPTGNLQVTAGLNLNGIGRGNGGTLVIRAKGVNNFVLNGNTTNSVNGVISVNGGANGGNAGSIDIEQSSINAGGGIVFNSATPLTAAAARGNAGSIRVAALGLLPIQFTGAASIDVSALFQDRNGGTIDLQAAKFVFGGGNVALTANAAGIGNGGAVTVRSTGVSGSASDVVVGTLANQFNITARGGSVGLAGGNGGTANLSVASASNNLIINPTGLVLAPRGGVGNGGTLVASSGLNLFVNGSLNLDSAALGGNGGSATLTSGANFPSFGIFAGATTNGINGSLTANALGQTGNGGTLSVTSTTAAGITLGAAQTIQANAGTFDGQGGSISLSATTNGTINLGSNAVPISVDGTGTKQGGTITLNSSILTVNAGANQTLQSRGGGLGGRGGTISVTVSSSGSPLTVGAGAGQLALAINSNGVGRSGTINLTTAAALNLNTNGLFLLGAAGNNVGATLNATAGTTGGFGNLTTIGAIDVGNGTGGLLNLRTQQAGTTILQTGLGALYSGRAVQLVTPGSLGSALAPIQTATSVDPSGGLQVQSTGAGSSAFVNQAGALALGTSTAGFQLNVTSNTEINVVGAISGANLSQINLTTTAALPGNGAINIRADVGGSSFATANINANGTGAITNSAGVVRVGTLNLTSGSGNIGTRASRVITTATSISANTSGNVFLFAAASPTTPGGFAPTVNIGTSSASAGTFDYLACGGINFVGNLNAPTLFLGTFSGDINASGSVLNTVGSIGITSANNATISKGSGFLSLLQSSVTNALNVTTQGVLTINGTISGNNLNFASNGAGGLIVIGADINGTNPTPTINSQVTFSSFSGSSLVQSGGTVAANTINFNMGSGAVGSNFSRINTNANFINNSGFGATNNVFINELNGVTVGTFGFVSAGGTFDLLVQDGQTTFQSINAGGLISIVKLANSGSLTQLAGGFTSNLGGGITLTTVGQSPISLNGSLFAGGTGAISITGVGAGASVTLGTVSANNANISVTSVSSGITQNAFTTVSTNNGNISLTGVGAGGNVILNGTVRTNSSGAISVTAVNGSIVMNSMSTGFTGPNNISVTAVGGSVTVNPNSFVSAGQNGNILLQANSGSVTLTNANVSSSGTGTIAAQSVGGIGGVFLGTLSSGAGNITVLSTPANSNIVGTGLVSSVTSSSGNITINAVGGGTAAVNLTSDVSTTTSGSVSVLSTGSGGVTVRNVRTGFGGTNNLSLLAVAGSVTVMPNSTISGGTNGTVTVQANTGSVTLTNATVSSSGTGTLTVQSVGGVGGVLLGTLSSGSGNISVLNTPINSSITGTGLVSSITSGSGSISIQAVGGGTAGINLIGDVSTTTTGNISMLATGSGGISVRNVRTGFTGPNNNISLTAPGVGGGITQAAFTSLSTGTGGMVTLLADAAVNLQNIMAGGAVSVQSNNAGITQAASTNVSGSSVAYNANNAAFGNITLNGMVRSNAGVLTMVAGNNIAINSSLTSTGGNLSVTANNGTIVSNTSGFMSASGGNLLVQTNNGASGNITLGAGLTVNNDMAGVRTLTVASARSATVGSLSNFDPTGLTQVTATTGVLQMNGSVSVQGDLNIHHTGGASAGDAIVLGNFVSLFALAPSAPQGNITIALLNGQALPPPNVVGVPPVGGTVTQSTSGGGQIFFGPQQFVNTGSTSLIAKGANITFFNNKSAGVINTGIQLNSNFIFADPPTPVSTPATMMPAAMPVSMPSVMTLPAISPSAAPAEGLRAPAAQSQAAPATQLQMPAAVQGIVDIFRPFFVSPTPATATPVDTAPQNMPVSTSTADVITQVRDAGGAMVQSAVTNVNNVLTGFVTKKSGSIGGASSYMRPSQHAVVSQLDDSTFELKHGEVIVSANRRSTVTSGEHTVDAAPGSIVHVTREGDVLKVRNLCDAVGKTVRVLVAGKSMPVNVGEEVVIGFSDGAVNSAIKGDNIGRRKVSRFVVDGRHSIVKSELSVVALIQKSNLLTSMYTKGSAADRNVMERIMKMAAALFQVTGKRGAYSAYDPSKVDAPIPLSSAIGESELVKVAHSK